MIKYIVVTLSLSFSIYALAQDQNNLVPNSSFESIEGKFKKLKQISAAKEWSSPTALNADLFSKKKEGPIGAPVNMYGKEHPKEGDNYAGIVVYSYNNKTPRTYIQVPLMSALTGGLDYCVKFHISLSDLSKYAVNNIGAHLGVDPLTLDSKGDIIFNNRKEFSNVVKDASNKIYIARYNWETVCGTFRANGKEKFITIGNFYNNKDTKYQKLKKLANFQGTQRPEAYYYVDNVEVFMIENPSDCDCMMGAKKQRESIVYHRDFADNGEEISVEEQLKRLTVYFDVESSKIDDMFRKSLDKLTMLLTENPELNLQLNGHTDKKEEEAIKNDPENELLVNLGIYRAKSIKDYIVKKGISSERLITIDAGPDQPAAPGLSMLSLAKNRRVEFIITK